MSLAAGTRLGPYEILAAIGAGGMGEVYKARDTRLDRTVAIKVLPPNFASDAERRSRFEREAKTVAGLSHAHICPLFDVGDHDGAIFLVMEYLDGQTLAQRLRKGPLPRAQVLEFGAQVADALAAAHRRGIVHRDLKPANIMLTKSGAKLLDFGLAKLRPQPSAAGIGASALTTQAPATVPGAVMGTVPYMAPEQLEGKETDARTDLFTLGCVLYEMLTARRAFAGDTEASVIAAIMTGEPPPLSTLQPLTPPALDRLVRRCLAKDPDDRWQTAADVAEELRGISQDAVATDGMRAAMPRRRRRGLSWARAAGGVLLLAMLAGGAWFGLRLIPGLRGRLLGPVGPPRIESLAVLPLQNLMGDPQQEYFVDGMTEALISDLANISALKQVISLTSARHYKGTEKILPEIGKELNVDAVIEGSVLRSGDRVRISAQLYLAATEQNLWAETFDRDLRDILALQSEVARAVAQRIQATLTPQEQTRLAVAHPVKSGAHDAYFRGRYYLNKWTEEGFKKGTGFFQQAIDLDPTYAPAYAGMADCYSEAVTFGALQAREAIPLATAAASKALELDETLAEAHATLGQTKFQFDWDWAGAEQELKRAVELSPSSSDAHFSYGFFLTLMGRSDESIAETRRALELDPLIATRSLQLGWVLYYARRHDESIAQLRKTLELAPNLAYANMELGWNYAQERMYPQAVAECRKAIEQQPEDQVTLGSCGRVYGLAGKRSEALDLLTRLKRMSERSYVDPYNIAILCDGLKDNNLTIEWLERAYRERSASTPGLKTEILSDSLRSDPRFQALLRKMNFPN